MQINHLESFYKRQARIYDITRSLFLFSHKQAVQASNMKQHDVVLDLACGTGLNIPHILQCTKPKNITALDYSKSMLKQLTKKYPYVATIQADASRYEAKSQYDKIICSYSLSMIDEREKVIKQCFINLKTGGSMIILDFNPHWEGGIIGYLLKKRLSYCKVFVDKDYKNQLLKYTNQVQLIGEKKYATIIVATKP